ncbi:unnamed protein product [Adineta steineri]|uniref:Uncharacterized protein n=1 Tax=Adineta steineri TaxID=433720 RepID=A0A814QQB8_9BILA|nr:unnamed protein product [Adineta steineri]CAF4043875.1 unnamed protein product [Adineta steineri]
MTSEAGVHFFNGLTGTKERFSPLKSNCINWYCCGDFHTNIDLKVIRKKEKNEEIDDKQVPTRSPSSVKFTMLSMDKYPPKKSIKDNCNLLP